MIKVPQNICRKSDDSLLLNLSRLFFVLISAGKFLVCFPGWQDNRLKLDNQFGNNLGMGMTMYRLAGN